MGRRNAMQKTVRLKPEKVLQIYKNAWKSSGNAV